LCQVIYYSHEKLTNSHSHKERKPTREETYRWKGLCACPRLMKLLGWRRKSESKKRQF
jgi:hypothetical protein